MENIFESVKQLNKSINEYGYICGYDISVPIYLAYSLSKPILLQGPAGVGKTEIAKVISQLMNNCDPIRLQCYEGLDASHAIYEWDYKKQLLYIEICKGKNNFEDIEESIYSDKFISVRPLLKSILSDKKEVILIDELDKSDEEFEAFLLEFLAEHQVSIAENRTIKANNIPLCFITSNNQRELSDALLRRCISIFIDYPTIERELEIIQSKVDKIDDLLATQIVSFVSMLRKENLKKLPSISETIDWVRALVKLGATSLSPKLVKNTLNLLLKTKNDIDLIDSKISSLLDKLPDKAIKMDKKKKEINNDTLSDVLNNDNEWNF